MIFINLIKIFHTNKHMSETFHIALILWDQKLGGVLEAAEPPLNMSSKITMNIYNMHRIRQTDPRFGSIRLKLDDGKRYNVLTFFTGYGGSTSPDGFTGNYGSAFGLAEHVFAMMLPMDVKTADYEEVFAKIISRLVFDPETIKDRLPTIVKLVQDSYLLKKPNELYKFLEKYLDNKLNLNDNEIKDANGYEVKALYYIIVDKKDLIQDLRINPAKSAMCVDTQKIADMEQSKKEVKELIERIQRISTEKQMTEAITSQQQETIETLKADYVKIFGTLTEQIMMLENELGAIKDSTQGLVMDLNTVLAEKIKENEELKQKVDELKAKTKKD